MNNRQKKERLLKEAEQRRKMEEYRASQNKFGLTDGIDVAKKGVEYVNGAGETASSIGDTLSKSSSKGLQTFGGKLSNVGNSLQNASGQQQINAIKSGTGNMLKSGASKLGTKMAGSGSKLISGLGSKLAGLGANAAATTGTTAATTAGTTAATTGAATAGGAGAGAAAGASAAVPVVGWVAAAAILANQLFQAQQKKKQAKAMAASQQEMQNSIENNNEAKSEAMQGLAEHTQDNLAQLQQQTQPENNNQVIVDDMMSQIKAQEQPQEDAITGGAAPVNYANPDDYEVKPLQLPMPEIKEESSNKQSMLDMLKSGVKNVGNIAKDFYAGYEDNVDHGFTEGDLYKGLVGAEEVKPTVEPDGTVTGGTEELKKSMMNRLGEAFGTGQRVLSNPLTQGLIAGVAYGADKGDALYGLGKGVEWAQNKAKSDYYGKRLDPNYRPTVFGARYDNKDYNAHTLNEYRKTSSKDRADKTNQQGYKTQATNLLNMLKGGMITPEEYTSAMDELNANYVNENYAVGVDNAQVSNDTKKVGIQQQNANTNSGRLNETKRHNKVMEGQGQERIDKLGKGNNKPNNVDYSNGWVLGTTPEGKKVQVPLGKEDEFRKNGGTIDG